MGIVLTTLCILLAMGIIYNCAMFKYIEKMNEEEKWTLELWEELENKAYQKKESEATKKHDQSRLL